MNYANFGEFSQDSQSRTKQSAIRSCFPGVLLLEFLEDALLGELRVACSADVNAFLRKPGRIEELKRDLARFQPQE